MKNQARQSVSRRGMTLIELMVAVALLAMMIASFSMILNNVQKLVYGSQTAMRSNASAAAVEHVIRKDIRSISMNGFLCIAQAPSPENTPQLFYCTAGTSISMTSSASGDGCITGMGLCKMNSGSDKIMWRGGWVLVDPSSPGGNDTWPWTFATIQNATRADLNTNVINYYRTNLVPKTLPVPPQNLDDMDQLWKYLAENCSDLTIMWTDDSPAAGVAIKWYGANSPKESYSSRNVNLKDGDGDYYIEFNDGGYRALWSQHNQRDWPKAIKISFTLNDVSKSTGATAILYEIICPLGQ